MNEQLRFDIATCRQATLATPRCSVNCELGTGTLPSGPGRKWGDQSREEGSSCSGGCCQCMPKSLIYLVLKVCSNLGFVQIHRRRTEMRC
jgi:hypothetical protein